MAKKKTGCGCCGVFAVFFALIFVLSLVFVSGLFYCIYALATDHRQFLTTYEAPVRFVARPFLSFISSEAPLDLGENEFNGDAYESFIDKQSALIGFFDNPAQENVPFQMTVTQEELVALFYAELAKMEINNYKLEFAEDKLCLSISIDGAILRPHLPSDLHPVLISLFEDIKYFNIDTNIHFSWRGGLLKTFLIEYLQVGEIRLLNLILRFIEQKAKDNQHLMAEYLNININGRNLRIDSIDFFTGYFELSGIYNPFT